MMLRMSSSLSSMSVCGLNKRSLSGFEAAIATSVRATVLVTSLTERKYYFGDVCSHSSVLIKSFEPSLTPAYFTALMGLSADNPDEFTVYESVRGVDS